MLQYDENLSIEVDGENRERQYDLEKFDITVRNLADVGVIATVAMESIGFEGSEDYSDLFDSLGILYQYAGNRMLKKVYAEHPVEEARENLDKFDWDEEKMDELHQSLMTLEQFGLHVKLVKKG